MVEIELVSKDKIEGWTEVVTTLRGEEISAETRDRVEVPLTFTLPEGAKAKKAYLDLTVSGVTDKWRVFLGDFSVTKVFKPLLQEEHGDCVLSKFVFDVTPIMHIVMEEPVLKIVNESNNMIKLVQGSLIIFYEYEGLGELDYVYGVSLAKHNSFWGELDVSKNGYLYGVFKAFPRSRVRVKVGDCVSESLVEDVAEVTVECEKAKSYFVEAEEPLTPLSLIVGSYSLNLPRIVIKEARYENGKVKVRVKNAGEDADDVIVLVYTLGTPLARTSLGPLKGGEERDVEFQVNVSKGMVGLNVRVIWIKAKLRDAVEKFIPL